MDCCSCLSTERSLRSPAAGTACAVACVVACSHQQRKPPAWATNTRPLSLTEVSDVGHNWTLWWLWWLWWWLLFWTRVPHYPTNLLATRVAEHLRVKSDSRRRSWSPRPPTTVGRGGLKNGHSRFVVEWLYYSARIITVQGADLGDYSLIFVCKMCFFVSCPMKIFTFHRNNRDLPKLVVDFL